ncbi:TPA: hypothetical protein IAA87_04560 [Candidatus Avigastranaerophilus faecigallinarum]|nr:hypothetical protein [Candidatus Avigastranaerophilus faecigallinarum]
MNKNFKVITINGIRGVLAAIFIVLGLIAGFIISPGWVCMHLWNHIFEDSNTVALMNIYQGIMLWAIIALSLYALNNKKALIGFGSYQGLSPEQIKDLMTRAKQSEAKMMNDIEAINKEIKMELEKKIISEKEQQIIKTEEKEENKDEKEEIRR